MSGVLPDPEIQCQRVKAHQQMFQRIGGNVFQALPRDRTVLRVSVPVIGLGLTGVVFGLGSMTFGLNKREK